MKKISKKIVKLLISLICIFLFCSILTNNSVKAISPEGLGTIYTNTNDSDNGRIDLKAWKEMEFSFDYNGMNLNQNTTNWDNRVLKQGNIFCIERKVYTAKNYVVSDEKTVASPYLSYILKDVKTDTITSTSYSMDPTQNALWDYLLRIKNSRISNEELEDYRNFGVSVLREGNSNIDISSITSAAWEYSNNYYTMYNNYNNSNLKLNLTPNANNNSFSISVEGNVGGNIESITSDGNSTINNNTGSFNNGATNTNVTVTINYGTTYKVYYRLLKNSGGQRLIAITKVEELALKKTVTANLSKPITENPISLQKFIVKKITGSEYNNKSPEEKEAYLNSQTINIGNTDVEYFDANNTDNYTMATQRYFKLAGDSTVVGNSKLRSTDDNTTYTYINKDIYLKEKNPVKISQGDLVTYEILLNNINNSNTDTINITDYITSDLYGKLKIGEGDSSDIKFIDLRAYYDVKNDSGNYQSLSWIKNNKWEINDAGEIIIKNISFNTGNTIKILITLQFNKDNCGSKLTNFAKMNRSYKVANDNNYSYYKHMDADVVKMATDNPISLQKFIVKKITESEYNNKSLEEKEVYLNSQTINIGNNDVEYFDANNTDNYTMATQRYFKLAGASTVVKDSKLRSTDDNTTYTYINKNKNIYLKEKNPVKISQGDLVTYEILLNNINNSNTGIINVKDYVTTDQYEKLKIEKADDAIIQFIDLRAYYDVKNGSGNYQPLPWVEQTNWEIKDDGEINIKDISFTSENTIKILITLKINLDYSEGLIRNFAKMDKAYTINGDANYDYYKHMDADMVKMEDTKTHGNISLQKYIVSTSDKDSNNAQQAIIGDKSPRINMNASDSSKLQINTNTFAPYFNADENNNISAKGPYKSENPVMIDIGDIVTYRIIVYNNETSKEKNIEVRDFLRYYDGSDIQEINDENIYEVLLGDNDSPKLYINGSNEGAKINYDKENETFSGFDLDGGEYAIIEFKVKMISNIDSDLCIANYAKIEGGNSNYRTMDADYIKMKKYSVSLEKYVSSVGNSSNNNLETLVDSNTKYIREGYPIYNFESGKEYKHLNPVLAELGDTITFNIKIKNTGEDETEYGTIKNILLNDNFNPNFVYDSCSGVTYIGKNENKIVLELEKEIKIGEEETFTITFKIKDTLTPKKTSLINNEAVITKILNRNDIEVTDSDGTQNNTDKDWIGFKKYAVKLEKYVNYVTDIKNSNAITYRTQRENHPTYEENGFSKENNSVKVETGDKVTYTIKLTNTGDNANNYGIINNLTITDVCPDGLSNPTVSMEDQSRNNMISYSNGNITYAGSIGIGDSITFNITYDVIAGDSRYENTKNITSVENTATVTEIKNRNSVVVGDSDGKENNTDKDWITLKTYAVSLEKYISKVNNTDIKERDGRAEHKYDNDSSTINDWKQNNVVTVSSGDIVTYTIILKNDSSETNVWITSVLDTLTYDKKEGSPNVKVKSFHFNNTSYTKEELMNQLANKQINSGKSICFTIDVEVNEPNISIDILKNTATINKMKNRNDIEVTDTTPNNNEDSDYVQLDYTPDNPPDNPPDDYDTVISGIVWNDTALDKDSGNYNGYYDDNIESKLSGITVYLYRNGVNYSIAKTTTDTNGYYKFTNSMIETDVIKNSNERYIKGPRDTNNRWAGTYYSYYVVFKYDGITYTSTFDKNNKRIWEISENTDNIKYSNAQENEDTRIVFNNRFSTINADSGIEYETENKEGYLPKSKYKYNSNMAIQSSTNLINLSDFVTSEDKLKSVNLGLRGRDVFDLELYSEVNKVEVKVNGVQGVYNYNKVTLRSSDVQTTYVDRADDQKIRNTDKSALQEIYVTYKITVKNESQTNGKATKMANYYDGKYYSFIEAYSEDDVKLEWDNISGLNGIEITMPNAYLSKYGSTNIFVKYKMNDAGITKIQSLGQNEVMATYNMAEITEYTTKCAANQTEYLRGLIDQDSAPGSVNKENARLIDSESANSSTLKYYFDANELSKLKYEDDTYATPTLYFVSSDYQREIKGTVFEDNTTVDATTKVKSGNGKIDDNEVGVYGATVELIENGTGVTYTTESNKEGSYTISGFLPGNYYLRYSYGDTVKTVLLNQSDDGSVNKTSYNGEDYQATNNSGISTTENYWHLENEASGYSIATDDSTRRKNVSEIVTGFTNEQMILMNNIRNGSVKSETDEVKNIISDTNMNATSRSFKIDLEKSSDAHKFEEAYTVSNMNFGVAAVPVTRLNLQKRISSFTITDASGENVLAKYDGQNIYGDVLNADEGYLAQIEDQKLQGAKLEMTFEITVSTQVEKDFRSSNANNHNTTAVITGLLDLIDKDLVYDKNLGRNSEYWNILEDTDNEFSVKLEANDAAKIKLNSGNENAKLTITLEKVLSAPNSSLLDIISSSVESYEYNNIIEITELDYSITETTETDKDGNVITNTYKDRIRTTDDFTIIPGQQYDTTTSDKLVITPPTGDSSIDTLYLIVITIGTVILCSGALCIKKFIIDRK